MIRLESLLQEDFEPFLEREMRGYAEDHVRNGSWPAKGALERSRKEFEFYLPDGIRSQDQSLWLLGDDSGNKIGVLSVQSQWRCMFLAKMYQLRNSTRKWAFPLWG